MSAPSSETADGHEVEQELREQQNGKRGHVSGWTVVNKQGDVDAGDESSSTSSLEFVVLDDDESVSFNRRQHSVSPTSLDIPSTPSSSSSTQSSPDEEEVTGDLEGSSSEDGGAAVEEDLRSDVSVEVLSSSPADDPTLPPTALGLQPKLAPVPHVEQHVSDEEIPIGSLSSSSASSLEVIHHPESASSVGDDSIPEILEEEIPASEEEEIEKYEAEEDEEKLSCELSLECVSSDEDINPVEQEEKNVTSGDEEDEEENEAEPEDIAVEEGAVGGLPLAGVPVRNEQLVPLVLRLKHVPHQNSESDSDSDFLRLDAQMENEAVPLLPESVQDLHSSGSSVGSHFRFVHHPHGHHPEYHFDDDDDSIPDDVDDRCESDISGIAADESDLSSMTYSIGDIPLTAGVKSYLHRPNSSLNSTLNFIAVVALILGLGIGIGHYLGTTEDDHLHEMQIAQMKNLQDDYLVCLRRTDILHDQLVAISSEEDKWAAVTSTWKQKYQELVVQKAELELQLQELDKFRTSGLSEVQELANDAQKLEIDNSQLQQSLSWQAKRAADLETKLSLLTREIHALTTNKAELEESRILLQETVERLEEEKSLLNAQLGADRQRKEELGRELVEATAKVADTLAKLETSQAELSRALFEQQELRSQLNHARLENADLKSAVAKGRYSQHPANMATDDLQHEADIVQEPTNARAMSRHPDADNPAEPNVRQRMTMKKEDPLEPVSPRHIKVSAEVEEPISLPMENSDIAPASSSQDPVIDKLKKRLGKVNQELEWERSRSELWQSLFTNERSERMKWESSSPNIFTCMQILLPKVSLSEFSQIVTGMLATNTTEVFLRNVAFFHNITADVHFADHLHNLWDQFQRYTKKADLKDYAKKAKKTYEEIENAMATKWEEFQQFTQSENIQKSVDSAKSGFANLVDKVVNITKSSKLHDAVNRTKETMSRLNDQLQDTWQKVKNLSSDFLKKPKHTVEKVTGKLSEKLDNIAASVHSHWEKVRDKFHKDGWSTHHWKHHKHHHKHDRHHGRHNVGSQDEKYYPHSQYGPSSRRPYNSEYSQYRDGPFENSFTDEHGKGPFEDKPHHKQRQSNHENEKYEEFWKQTEYDPDDFMHDGFFEGNNREWRKHQKTLKKLHGRIHRLNEDVLHAMDDDDIEDIYEDLEDFQDDIEDEVQPEKLKTWLTCQLLWWKSRFQRKHRSQDWVHGCGKQLMHWQLKVLCKPKPRCKGKRCRDWQVIPVFCKRFLWTVPGNNCHGHKCKKQFLNKGFQQKMVPETESHLHSHIPHQSHKTTQSQNHKQQPQANKNEELNLQNSAEETVNATFWELVNGDQADWYFRRAQDREDHLVNAKWYFHRAENREDHHHSPLWYVKAISERSPNVDPSQDQSDDETTPWVWEYPDQEPDWVFARAQERDFERSKPWYLHRAEDREYQHKIQE